jgi:predicted metal-dependent phosphoesterase TrpH
MIDLHSHTDESDGTFTPEQLVAEAVRIGLSALAVTDHDTMRGYEVAVPYAQSAGLELICGIELSTRFGGASVHLLGYFPCSQPPEEFREWLKFLLASRRDRNARLVDRLRALGVDITLPEVEARGRSLTGRPHFAKILVEKGYASDLQNAFDEFLDESAKGYVERHEVPIDEAIGRLVAAGGVASLAHPVRVAKNDWTRLTEYVEKFAGMGMRALEVYHSDHSPENVAFYLSLAKRFGLTPTGGSDFHGGNKPFISLGSGLRNNLAVPDSILTGLKECANRS